MEVSGSDEEGGGCGGEEEFVVFWLKEGVGGVKSVEWLYEEGRELEEREGVRLYVGSSEKNVDLLYDV